MYAKPLLEDAVGSSAVEVRAGRQLCVQGVDVLIQTKVPAKVSFLKALESSLEAV